MKKTIKNKILHKIKSGEVKMRSRTEILGEKLGISSGIILLFAALIIISGLVSYWFKLNSDLIFGGYGKYGLRILAQTFPYAFVFSFIVFFIFLSITLKRFDFSYKKPFITILSVLAGIVLVLGWFSIKTPYIGSIYMNEEKFFGMGRMMNGAYAVSGVVVKTDDNLIIIDTGEGNTVNVLTTKKTHYPFGTPETGDAVRSVGNWKDGIFEAVGVRVFDGEDSAGRGMMKGRGKGRRFQN